MKPVIALVGRPNVGKSTLFNCLTRSRDALVADFPGLTRDRKYGTGQLGERPYLVVDTGGLSGEKEGIDSIMARQARLAIDESDAVVFLVDGRAGLNAADQVIADFLRQCGKPVYLAVNKVDGIDPDVAASDFHALGIGEPYQIAAAHGRGVRSMMNRVLETFPTPEEGEADAEEGIRVAIIGRPNVGKSTLVNRIMGEERVIVFDMPGTTRDSIRVPFARDGQPYLLIDTAGVRRRGRVREAIEKFSIIKTLQAISDAHVVIMVLDARDGITEQDAHLLGFALDSGRALVVAVNKWDGLDQYQKEKVRRDIDRKLPFLDFAPLHYISALHGTGVGNLFGSVNRAYRAANSDIPTPKLTKLLETAVANHQPPLVQGSRIKLRYAHQGGRNPPTIIIHGSRTDSVPGSYSRYLEKFFREQLKLHGTPVRIEYRSGDNPYAGRKNELTERQKGRKRRLMQHVKKKEKKSKRR
ncbi:ribosome biogenesis GTPase Der [Thiohalomonas denitrificans]|uniref:GTPase Der n=1 Tax=Thiohalomonas denitrificans TaxID=415747 RepID=A0A1G5Q1P0_9GAMM|nr:ribosome biogenesis GTPase Der [Thiohalomonas denitrificans]SCZ55528.1 GTP-binding protein [Thiohalomonas denitrificans]